MLETIRRRCPWLPAAALLLAGLAVPLASAAIPSPAYSPKAKAAKIKNQDWIGQWYQWAYNAPETNSPLYDDTGANAGVGQRGPVWFLCGDLTIDGTVTRNIKVPEGVSLFFPLIEVQIDNADPGIPADTQEELALFCKGLIDLVNPAAMTCVVDGVAVTDLIKRRVVATPFRYVVVPGSRPENVFNATPGDVVFPAVSDGYWMMLKPLPVGAHTIVWSASIPLEGDDYVQNITYLVNVVPATNQP
jgi:hypothetical protein